MNKGNVDILVDESRVDVSGENLAREMVGVSGDADSSHLVSAVSASTAQPIPVTIENNGLGLSDWLNIVMVIVAVVSLGLAAYSIRQSARTNKEASQNAKLTANHMESIVRVSEQSMQTAQDQLERLEGMISMNSQILDRFKELVDEFTRPRMSARLSAPKHKKGFLPLVLENVGTTSARNVRVSFDPSLPEPNLEKLNENISEQLIYRKSPVEMTRNKFENKVFKSWPPKQKTAVPFWAMKFERHPLQELGEAKRFENDDGSPLQVTIIRASTDGVMLLDESADGVPADIKVIIEYEDDRGKSWKDEVNLNPNVWVSTTFRSEEHDDMIVEFGGDG